MESLSVKEKEESLYVAVPPAAVRLMPLEVAKLRPSKVNLRPPKLVLLLAVRRLPQSLQDLLSFFQVRLWPAGPAGY